MDLPDGYASSCSSNQVRHCASIAIFSRAMYIIQRILYYTYKYINCTKALTLGVEFKTIKNRKEFFFRITKILVSQAKDNVDLQHENFFLMCRYVKILL